MKQLTIHDAPMRRTTDPDTCQTPAPSQLSAGRATALQAHFWAMDTGLTDFELAEITGRAQTSIGCRRKDLARMEPPLIAATDERRPSPTGSPSIVWKITAAGIDWHRSTKEAS